MFGGVLKTIAAKTCLIQVLLVRFVHIERLCIHSGVKVQ